MDSSLKRPRSQTPKAKAYLQEQQDKEENRIRTLANQLKKELKQEKEAATALMSMSKEQLDSDFDPIPTNTYSIRGNFDPESKLTKILEGIYGPPIVRKFMNNNGKRERAARKIVELVSPTIQCTNTIGNEGIDICWLCGGQTKDNAVLKPICEHILPIAQAVFFLKLYNTQDSDKYAVTEKLEYGWSHAYCNLIKSARFFIKKESEYSSRYIIDRDSIAKFRSDLMFDCNKKLKTNTVNAISYQSIIDSLNRINPETGEHAMIATINKKLDPVINFINSRSEDEQNLVLLARVAGFVNPTNLNPEFIGRGKTRRRKHKRKRTYTKRIKMI